MAPIVADGIIRFTVIGQLLDQDCFNIIDVDVDTQIGTDRAGAAFVIAGDIINNWDDHIVSELCSDYSFLRVDWVDLNSLDGTVGSRSSTSDTTLPQAGRFPGQAAAGHTYAKVRKNLEGSARNSRRGILRLSGLTEEQVSGNNLTSATVTSLNAAFEDFKDGIQEGAGGVTRNLAVVHNPEGGPVTSSHISTYQVEPVLGTIRRRMPGYGT